LIYSDEIIAALTLEVYEAMNELQLAEKALSFESHVYDGFGLWFEQKFIGSVPACL